MSELAQAFDRAAADYERGRPGWPPDVLDVVEFDTDATVLDLAAGTGKLTRVLARRFAHVIAVEPLDGMRVLLEELVPEAEAFAGSAESIPLGDESVDAAFVAEAFHWFGSNSVVAELARVLRPGGPLVILWNQSRGPREPALPEQVARRLKALREGVEFPYGDGRWREALERGPFGPIAAGFVEHDHVLDREGVIAQFSSYSWIARRPPAERAALVDEIRPQLPDVRYSQPFRAEVYWTRRAA